MNPGRRLPGPGTAAVNVVITGGPDRFGMTPTPDELAGIVDGFGGLTRDELATAAADLAARAGDAFDRDALLEAIDEALGAYYLLEVDAGAVAIAGDGGGPEGPLLVPGPAALPALPEGGEDLPHLLDVETRAIDREAAAEQVEGRLRADAAAAIDAADAERAERLLDACYEVEAWGPVDLADARAGLAELLE